MGRLFDLTDVFSKNSVYVRAAFVELISLQLTSLILIILFVFLYRLYWGGGKTLNKFLKN